MPFPTRTLLSAALAFLATPATAQRWATVWAGADQGPYPSGNASAQPDLSFVFAHPETGAHEQSFRLIIKPDLSGGGRCASASPTRSGPSRSPSTPRSPACR